MMELQKLKYNNEQIEIYTDDLPQNTTIYINNQEMTNVESFSITMSVNKPTRISMELINTNNDEKEKNVKFNWKRYIENS